MKTCKEMRRTAWEILRGKWFLRLLVVGCVLQTIVTFVNGLITSAFTALAITSLPDFCAKKVQALQQGIDYTLPTLHAYGWMAGGFLFQSFIAYIFTAILSFGFMGTLLKAERNETNRWFADAFGGFARPFEVTGLLVLMNLRVFLWSLLMVIPGLVAAYRYRLAWFLKNEHPELSARACLAESGRLMKGHKKKAFLLDLSFVGWTFLACATSGLAIVLSGRYADWSVAIRFAGFLLGVFGFYFLIKVILGLVVSRVVFYRELQPRQALADGAAE